MGIGLLTIFRLNTSFGYRQSVWIILSIIIICVGIIKIRTIVYHSTLQIHLAIYRVVTHSFTLIQVFTRMEMVRTYGWVVVEFIFNLLNLLNYS